MLKGLNIKYLSTIIIAFTILINCQNKSYPPALTKVDVKQFGAKGNGKTDDTKAIILADLHAAKNNKILFFPDGEYLCFGIRPTSSWIGENKSVLKSLKRTAKPNVDPFIYIKKQNNLSFKNLHFDGNISEDPKVWNEKNVNNFEGHIPLYIGRSTSIKIQNCHFSNSMKGCLTMAFCEDIQVSDCTFKHARSPFGDGIYVAGSQNIRIDNCHASDYTRIGFVIENQSSDVIISNCTAINGHHQSSDLGGTQFNAGIWIENSGDVEVDNCITKDQKKFGIVVSFNELKNKLTNKVSITNSETFNSMQGFYLSSGNQVSMNSKVSNCTSNNGPVGFITTTRHPEDNFNFDNCVANIKFSPELVNDGAFLWKYSVINPSRKRPNININNCSIKYINSDLGKIKDPKTNTADFACYDCGPVNININNCHNTKKDIPLSIKSRSNTGYFDIKNATIEVISAKRGTAFELDNVTYTEQTNKIFNSSKFKVTKKKN